MFFRTFSLQRYFNCSSLLVVAFCAIIACGCVPLKKLGEGKVLLFEQEIDGSKEVSEDELIAFYRQRPNRKFGGTLSHQFSYMPWLYAYFQGKRKYDNNVEEWKIELDSTKIQYQQKIDALQEQYAWLQKDSTQKTDYGAFTKDSARLIKSIRKLKQQKNDKEEELQLKIEEGNWLMRTIGEEPVIFDPELAEVTASQMEKYLATKGHFRSKVGYSIDTLGKAKKKVKVTYLITEAEAYRTRIFEYLIPDTTVYDLVHEDRAESWITEGERYNEQHLERERKRLVTLLKNNGYYDFNSSFIRFEVDSTIGKRQVDIRLLIDSPEGKQQHTKYYIDEILFETDVDISNVTEKRTVSYEGISFKQESGRYSKRVLASKVYFRKDSLYRLQNIEDTQIALSQMDMFKFVNINFEKKGGNRLKVSIFTSDYDKYQYAVEAGLNVTRSLPGPFVSVSLKNRNMLNQADLFEISGRLAFEAQGDVTNTNNNYSSQEYGLNGSLSLPYILLPISRQQKRAWNILQPRTILQVGYNLVDRPEYRRSSLQGSTGYQWVNRKNQTFNWGIADVSILESVVTPSFDSLLTTLSEQGSNLQLSFQNSFISHTNFSFTKASQNYGSLSEKSSFFKVYTEIGGLLSNFWNNRLNERNGELLGLRYFRYYRFYIDYRHGIPLSLNNLIASRLHIGLAQPFGQDDNTLPYEKYFFTGGSNSNRAWRARRIGPGSYSPDLNDDGTFNYQGEQPGELLIEANVEWRFKLFSFVDWAFFSDASNVWQINPDPSRPGGQFRKDTFWNEFAVGAGYGLRLDFSFLLIRLDIGTKIHDPARELGNRFILKEWLQNLPFGQTGQTEFNIGIGYPF